MGEKDFPVFEELVVLNDFAPVVADEPKQGQERTIFQVDGMDCGECARTVERVVSKLNGVSAVQVNFNTTKMTVDHSGPLADLMKTVEQVGYRATMLETTLQELGVERPSQISEFALQGMDCADCAAKIEKRLSKLDGVLEVQVNFGASKLKVKHTGSVEAILRTVDEAGYAAEWLGQKSTVATSTSFWERHRRTLLTVLSGVLLGAGFLAQIPQDGHTVSLVLFLLSMVTGGYYAARAGYYALKSLTLDMNFLMVAAAIGAAVIGQWSEGATVIFLFAVGNWLQSVSMDRTRRSIRSLLDLTPKEAVIQRDGQERKLPVSEIQVDDRVIVRPGERIPMDGLVVSGQSTVNQAPITGESLPVQKQAKDEVFAGTINESGALVVRVTKRVEDTTLSRIIHLVEEAQAQKAPSQQFVDVFAKYYTPAVVLLALLVAILPPLFTGDPFVTWIYRALVLLVIACPCALVISTPVSIVSAIGSAAKRGVLIKGGAYLELMGSIRAIAFDKTGTLTEGQPKVVQFRSFAGVSEEAILEIAAAIESRSEHPLARAIMFEAEKYGLELAEVSRFQAIAGKGAEGWVDGALYRIGKPAWFEELEYERLPHVIETQQVGRTVILLGDETSVLGLFAVADVVRASSEKTIQQLKAAGIAHTVMLTGDNSHVAAAIQRQVGVDAHEAELLPEQKVDRIRSLQQRYGRVAMVGDGINDAPALATADIGIAMGGAGTDTALETADIVLMSDDLSKLPFAVRLSRKSLTIIKQNIWFSLLVKLVFLVLTILGQSNLWMAVFADTGAALLVIANAMRLMGTQPK